ncbi:hypothetical protein MMC24_002933 [Lignoscripta atroalba]|nr:hypothetical protein [Lignoscripta atroalba]
MGNDTKGTDAAATSATLFGTSKPNVAMGYIAVILFSLTALIHLFQYFKNRAWFLYFLGLGILMEVAAYLARLINMKNMNNQGAGIIWYFTIMLAPSLLAAACYMIFGRIIYWVTPESRRGFRHLWVPARFIAIFFIFWDVLSFVIQCLALIIILSQVYNTDTDTRLRAKALKTGYNVLKIGFIMQICVFGTFALLALRFMFVSKQWRYDWPEGGNSSWRKLAWTIAGVSCLIAVRAIYRMLEFTVSQGTNYLSEHEWCFYIFDSLIVMVLLVSLNLVHPGHYMPRDYCTFGHDFKKPGFKKDPIVRGEEPASARFSHISLVPQPLVPSAGTPMGQPDSSSKCEDPWNHRMDTPSRYLKGAFTAS